LKISTFQKNVFILVSTLYIRITVFTPRVYFCIYFSIKILLAVNGIVSLAEVSQKKEILLQKQIFYIIKHAVFCDVATEFINIIYLKITLKSLNGNHT